MPSPHANPTQLPGRTSASGHGGGRGRWRVGWCLLAALGLHAALGIGLLLRAQALVPGASASAPGNPARAAVHTLQVRWTPPARGPHRAGEAGAMRDEHGQRGEIDSFMQTPEPPPATVAAPGPADLPAHSEGALAARGDEGAGAGSGRTTETPTDTPTEAPFTGYARRDMLDRPPQALGIVQITYPPGVEPGRVRTGRLTLFIDEAGAVRKVMVWPPTDAQDALPPPFVQAAREAFLQARFAPGERHGLPVKSRIDIEVSFDGRETTPLETAQQPQDAVGVDRSV